MCTGNCYRHRAPVFRSYGFGLRNLSDPWFTQKFTNIYKGPGLQVPWFAVLGSEFELQIGRGSSRQRAAAALLALLVRSWLLCGVAGCGAHNSRGAHARAAQPAQPANAPTYPHLAQLSPLHPNRS